MKISTRTQQKATRPTQLGHPSDPRQTQDRCTTNCPLTQWRPLNPTLSERCGQQAESDRQASIGMLERNSQSTRMLHGRTHRVNYDTKWHPMDEWTTSGRSAKRRSGLISSAKDESKHAAEKSEQKSSSPEEIEMEMFSPPRDPPVQAESLILRKHILYPQKTPVNKTSHYTDGQLRPKKAAKRRASIVVQDSDFNKGSIIREDTYEEIRPVNYL